MLELTEINKIESTNWLGEEIKSQMNTIYYESIDPNLEKKIFDFILNKYNQKETWAIFDEKTDQQIREIIQNEIRTAIDAVYIEAYIDKEKIFAPITKYDIAGKTSESFFTTYSTTVLLWGLLMWWSDSNNILGPIVNNKVNVGEQDIQKPIKTGFLHQFLWGSLIRTNIIAIQNIFNLKAIHQNLINNHTLQKADHLLGIRNNRELMDKIKNDHPELAEFIQKNQENPDGLLKKIYENTNAWLKIPRTMGWEFLEDFTAGFAYTGLLKAVSLPANHTIASLAAGMPAFLRDLYHILADMAFENKDSIGMAIPAKISEAELTFLQTLKKIAIQYKKGIISIENLKKELKRALAILPVGLFRASYFTLIRAIENQTGSIIWSSENMWVQGANQGFRNGFVQQTPWRIIPLLTTKIQEKWNDSKLFAKLEFECNDREEGFLSYNVLKQDLEDLIENLKKNETIFENINQNFNDENGFEKFIDLMMQAYDNRKENYFFIESIKKYLPQGYFENFGQYNRETIKNYFKDQFPKIALLLNGILIELGKEKTKIESLRFDSPATLDQNITHLIESGKKITSFSHDIEICNSFALLATLHPLISNHKDKLATLNAAYQAQRSFSIASKDSRTRLILPPTPPEGIRYRGMRNAGGTFGTRTPSGTNLSSAAANSGRNSPDNWSLNSHTRF